MPVDPSGDRERDADRTLHARLLAGESDAPADLFACHLAPTLVALRRSFPRIDPHDLEEIASDSLMRLSEDPARYDPDRGSLASYLLMDARGDVLNFLRQSQRRTQREISLESVEDWSRGGNRALTDPSDPVEHLTRKEERQMARAWVDEHFAGRDREVVWLMMQGERRTPRFAEVLGVAHLPITEQRRIVKRAKDRIKAHVRRHGIRLPPNE